jgi:UDP-N-acetylmuramate--alanine ligase
VSHRTPPGSEVPDLKAWSKVHLVGIGGAGMSGIARLLLARGIAVSGSDLKDSRSLPPLREAGAVVFVGHSAAHVGEPDAVAVSTAIPAGNPEVREAQKRGIRVVTRAQVLAALMRGKRTVAVAGTHGKTTTTSMVTVMCSRLGLEPSFVIGGDVNEIGSGAGHGSGDVFVAEADESDGSFLLYHPDLGVITNVEQDHVDFYRSQQDVETAFAAFAGQSRSVIACWDDPGVRRALSGFVGNVLRYGVGADADMAVMEVELRWNGSTATIRFEGEEVPLLLSVPGRHNLLNAAAALGVAARLGLPLADAAEALRSFSGVRRRFECRGMAGGATFIDDYAHHPSEVAATLGAAQIDGRARVVAVFQPHRYTRTQAMWRSLGESLQAADVVVITDVYGAGESPIPGVTGKLLVEALTEAAPGKRVVYLPRRSEVAPFLVREVRDGDLILTLGAGDITMVAEATLDLLRSGSP